MPIFASSWKIICLISLIIELGKIFKTALQLFTKLKKHLKAERFKENTMSCVLMSIYSDFY